MEFNAGSRWFSAFIFVQKPEKFLCYEINPIDIETRAFNDALIGAVSVPKKIKLSLPDVFGGRCISLYEIPYARTAEIPNAFIYCERGSVIVADRNWHCEYNDSIAIRRYVDYLTVGGHKKKLHLQETLLRAYHTWVAPILSMLFLGDDA